jgi:nitrite reductase/ring-hydroxylating ferredoxin subunit
VRGLDDIDATSPVGTIAAADIDGAVVAVIRHAAGWVLVDGSCTHAHCPFSDDGEVVDGYTLVCNCHGSEYDLRTGEVLAGPARAPLAVVALSVESGTLRRP